MIKDLIGQELEPGVLLAKSYSLGRSNALDVGILKKIDLKNAATDWCTSERPSVILHITSFRQNYKGKWSIVNSKTSYPGRALVLTPEYLSKVPHELKQLILEEQEKLNGKT